MSKTSLSLDEARHIAVGVMLELDPHCDAISLAGALRRDCPSIDRIEIVCVPRPYKTSQPASGIATVVNRWPKVSGRLPCCWTQRILSEGIKLDLFMVHYDNFGLQRVLRTGSADWCRTVLHPALIRAGYRSAWGFLRRIDGTVVPVQTEPELFRLIGLKWVHPRDREVQP